MPPTVPKQAAAVVLVCGEDEFAVKQRAKAVFQQWTKDIGGSDHEIIDAAAANSGEALKALRRVREALQTLPFFGDGKAVWMQNCNFLGEERTGQRGGGNGIAGGTGAGTQDLPLGQCAPAHQRHQSG